MLEAVTEGEMWGSIGMCDITHMHTCVWEDSCAVTLTEGTLTAKSHLSTRSSAYLNVKARSK